MQARHHNRGDRFHTWDAIIGAPVRHVPHMSATPHRITRARHMQYVRQAVTQARIDSAEPTPVYDPLTWLREDVAAGTFPSSGLITERTSYMRDNDPTARVKCDVQAPAYMLQLERLHRDYARVQRGYSALMSHDASGEGRGTIQAASRIPDAVNGTETRVAPRWTASRRALITTTDDNGDTVPVDWGCYRVQPDGTRVPLVTTRTARKRKSAAGKASATARLQAIATTDGHVEAVTSS